MMNSAFNNQWHYKLTNITIVSLMRHEVNIDLKYDDEDENLEESKEEEVP